MKNNLLERVQIVLCRPEGALNVGSICRSMENTGISKLAIVGDISELDRKQIKQMAIHAYSIFESANFYTSLDEALSQSVIATGITRRKGNKRKNYSLLPEELAEKAGMTMEGEISLVFGNEQNGLNDKELACCTSAAFIPSHPNNPSYNLAQAVQILCYTFYRQSEEKVGNYSPVDLSRINDLSQTIAGTLEDIGYFNKTDRYDTPLFFRDILGRAVLSPKEAAHMENVFQKIKYLKKDLHDK